MKYFGQLEFLDSIKEALRQSGVGSMWGFHHSWPTHSAKLLMSEIDIYERAVISACAEARRGLSRQGTIDCCALAKDDATKRARKSRERRQHLMQRAITGDLDAIRDLVREADVSYD